MGIKLCALLISSLWTMTAAVAVADTIPATCPLGMRGVAGVECGHLPLAGSRLFFARLSGGDGVPMVLVPGGPGVAPSGDGEGWLNRLAVWRRARPVILLDLRGTGLSGPDMTCPEQTADKMLQPEKVAACRRRLNRRGDAPAVLDSRTLAADIIALRQALGIRRWVLYGISHGTRVALTAGALDPDGTAALVLDSLRPSWRPFYSSRLAAQRLAVAQQLAAECQAQPACAQDYPDLDATLRNLLSPGTPAINAEEEYVASERRLQLVSLMSRGLTRPLVPFIASRWQGAEAPAMDKVMALLARPSRHTSIGHHLAVICAEDLPKDQGAEAFLTQYRAACAAWTQGVAAPPAAAILPPATLPILILAGRRDALTPFDAAEITENLPGAIVRPVDEAGHDVLQTPGCATHIVAQFLADPTSQPGDCPTHKHPIAFAGPQQARRQLGMEIAK